jgi:hypothetical protein
VKRDKLKDVMARRSPLAQRESVEPVDLYAAGADGHEPAAARDTLASSNKRTRPQADKSTKRNVDLLTMGPDGEGEMPRRRYTTYVRPETIKAVKRLAVEGERNDYEIVQDALDEYLSRHGT